MTAPGSFEASTPVCAAACQNATGAPAGSAATTNQPWPGISIGGATTVPPCADTAAAVASASVVARYVVQAAGGEPSMRLPIAATRRPSRRAVE
ncbi:hypothetical protein GCM10025868_23990 [Angustibacter aerolatus]|uniref:Uncharacterized protein n=1 Tax=Angustibacter aerolatus TaxID=1162965 RepID=A0ABQ6JH57_9ACTN|nr:hypothetical protein GCM10025868_23990 [Angustibacter aerolatus]